MNSKTTTWHLDGLCCAEEEILIRKNLDRIDGIREITFNSLARTVTIHHTCDENIISGTLQQTGFLPRIQFEHRERLQPWERFRHRIMFLCSAIFFLLGLLLARVQDYNEVSVAFFLISITVGGWQIVLKAYGALTQKTFDMNVLMMAAVVGAAVLGKWEEGSAVVVLFSLSHLLERYSVSRSREALQSLLTLSPQTARVKRLDTEIQEPVENITIGDHIIIRPGERIPLDGNVVGGDSTVNQAPITGESVSVRKQSGDTVYAGSLNERGMLEVSVITRHTDTMLARIVRLVEASQSKRAPVQQIADQFSRYYTPCVFALAVFIALIPPLLFGLPFDDWFYRALVLLVIACPCALIISTPVALFSAMTTAARHGILVKGGKAMEAIGKVRAIAFDKTGTLTRGESHVTEIVSLSSYSEQELLRLAASIEKQSEHHLADAVLRKASGLGESIQYYAHQSFESLTGRGAKAVINETAYFVGNRTLFEEMNIITRDVEKVLERFHGKTHVIVGTAQQVLGVLAVADELRDESRQVVERLHSNGITTIMITGDNKHTARIIAEEAGVKEFVAEVLPGQKAENIDLLKHQHGAVAMVGDGINDAPALSAATVGIAMGKTGTGIAMETADIVLMTDDLNKIPFVIQLSRATISIIKQNIVLAVATKMIFLFLGVFGVATLWMGILADDGATLAVILNSLRMLKAIDE